jgi:hypothetical protein
LLSFAPQYVSASSAQKRGGSRVLPFRLVCSADFRRHLILLR